MTLDHMSTPQDSKRNEDHRVQLDHKGHRGTEESWGGRQELRATTRVQMGSPGHWITWRSKDHMGVMLSPSQLFQEVLGDHGALGPPGDHEIQEGPDGGDEV